MASGSIECSTVCSALGVATHSDAPAKDRSWQSELFRLPVNLDGGEVIILAIKPSCWFIFFDSVRWLVGCLFVAGTAGWTSNAMPWISQTTLIQAALLVAVFRVGIAILRWASRFYVLTNRRIMRVKGVFRVDVFAYPLLSIRTTRVTYEPLEKWMNVGTLRFNIEPPPDRDASWRQVQHPEEVHAQVRKAIQRAIDTQPPA